MAFVSSPGIPSYRVTLFYGPEIVGAGPNILQCVFNVKKRSWKGGVQVVVAIEESQLQRIKDALQIDHWLHEVLSPLPEEEHSDYSLRAQDLLVQQVCHLKLQLAIRQGIRQENSELDGKMLWQELDEAAIQEGLSLKEQVLAELDIHSWKDTPWG